MRDWAAYVRANLPALHLRPEREQEIIAELAAQLEQAYADAIAGGAAEDAALARATRQLGDWSALAHGIEDGERPGRAWTGAWGDVRYALRGLLRNPVFAIVAAATLAFAIGGNTAVFSLTDALLLHGVPYRAPEQLIAIETRKTRQPEIESWASMPDYYDFRERARSYSVTAGISPRWSVVITGRGPAETLDALFVSASFFPMLGVRAELGRTFAAEEDPRAGRGTVAVLSYAFWQRKFGGSRDVIGQSVHLDSRTYTIIGVLPKSFRWVGEPLAGTAIAADVWLPLAANQLVGSDRSLRFLKVVGRLKPDVTPAKAGDEARRLGAQLADEFPATNRGYGWSATPLETQVTGRVRMVMLLLVGSVAFVLLMACANVANLLLARAAARQKEIAVRVAVGASRMRLVRQLLIEGLLLAAIGGSAGIPLAAAALRFFTAAAPDSLGQGREFTMDARALAFTGFAVLACALFAGLPPALRVTGGHIGHALRDAGRGLVTGNRRLRTVLVAGQIALALVLLVGAGLLIRSFRNLLEVHPGIEAHNLISLGTQLPSSARTPEQRKAIWERVRASLESTPGVTGTALVSRLPFSGGNLGTWIFVEGRSVPGEPGMEAEYRVCTANYFTVMGIPLRAGRFFDTRDDANPGSVAIINQTMARQLWPGIDPVGKRMKLGSTPETEPWITVIGVVGDVRHFGLEVEPRPEMYRTYAVNPLGSPFLVARTRVDAASLVAELSAKVRAIDPDMPTSRETVMERLVARSTAQRRFVMMVLAGFALVALAVAGAGIYGIMAQAVAQRTAEIGLRMALGATPSAVFAMVFRQATRVTGAGIATGFALAAGLAWLMRGLLFGVPPLDPVAFLAAAVTLAAFALTACYVPARRATRVDPVVALHE